MAGEGSSFHLGSRVDVAVATIWCPIYVLWLSVAGQLPLRFSCTALMNVTGGHDRPETQPPFRVVLHSEEIPN